VRRRQRSLKVEKRNESVLGRIKELKSEHPFWGYRRIWAQLTYGKDKLKINKKRVLRLLREHNLLAGSKRAFKASREVDSKKPRPTEPHQWWGIDMTKIMVQDFGWIYIVFVLDWYTKKVVGYYAGSQSKSSHWLMALNMAVNRQFPEGARGHGLNLMSDNGSQPTSTRFMKDCNTLGISQAFTSYNNPKGNADTERMFRTLKEELLWLQEWHSPVELGQKLEKWIADYNATYLHSTLGYRSPEMFEKLYYESQKSTIEVA